MENVVYCEKLDLVQNQPVRVMCKNVLVNRASFFFIFFMGRFIMKIRYILLISLIINLFSGCTEKNDIANDLEKKRLNQQNTNSLSETHPNADRQKKNRIVVEHCNGIANCVCDSLRDIASYDYKGKQIFWFSKGFLLEKR